MSGPTLVAACGAERRLRGLAAPLPLADLVPGAGPWEVEIGSGKGRYLLARAAAEPQRRFLGIEVAGEYYRLMRRRAERRQLRNLALLRGEALYLLAAVLPRAFAAAVHVYFPDPWPKLRHRKRRLFDPDSVDLVLGLLAPGGRLYFATDHLEYGEEVGRLLAAHPALALEHHGGGWGEGARTHYEDKYLREGRPIVRLTAALLSASPPYLHPEVGTGLVFGS